MIKNTDSTWLVEERDFNTGQIKFSQTYTDYSEAMATYHDRKRANLMNTVSIEKCERRLLQE
jgi:hypothetical protein